MAFKCETGRRAVTPNSLSHEGVMEFLLHFFVRAKTRRAGKGREKGEKS